VGTALIGGAHCQTRPEAGAAAAKEEEVKPQQQQRRQQWLQH